LTDKSKHEFVQGIRSDFVSVGKVFATFGLKGHLKVESSGDILENLPIPIEVKVGERHALSSLSSLKILSLKKSKNYYILLFDKIDSIEKAEKLKSQILYLEKSKVPAVSGKDEFYIFQLIGLRPFSEKFKLDKFSLVEVMENPAHPILIFSDGEMEVLVPFLDRFVKKIDLENSTVEIPDWENWIED